jgi:glycosyltransferase involved in cell wall biosynthesis
MAGKMCVLHIIPNFGPGGAERLVIDLMEIADKNRFEVAAVSLYSESGTILEKEIKKRGLKVYFLNKHRGLDLRMIPQLYYLFRVLRPDIVHTHRYVLRYTLLPTLFCHIPVRVHTLHNVAQREVDRVGKLVQWVAFRMGNVVPVSISQEVAKTVQAIYGRDIYTPVIYNGIPTSRFILRAEQGNAKNKKNLIVLHIGRFAPQKNHLLLIEAFAMAFKKNPIMQLWLVGDGPLRPTVEKIILEKGLEENVVFFGIREDVPKLLALSDMLVLSSYYEGVPLTVLEAMAAGKPVVATAVGGVPELIEDGVTGILVSPNNPEALAKGILHLAKDTNLRQRMGRAAQEHTLDRFDISRTARGYEALYLCLLKKCGLV